MSEAQHLPPAQADKQPASKPRGQHVKSDEAMRILNCFKEVKPNCTSHSEVWLRVKGLMDAEGNWPKRVPSDYTKKVLECVDGYRRWQRGQPTGVKKEVLDFMEKINLLESWEDKAESVYSSLLPPGPVAPNASEQLGVSGSMDDLESDLMAGIADEASQEGASTQSSIRPTNPSPSGSNPSKKRKAGKTALVDTIGTLSKLISEQRERVESFAREMQLQKAEMEDKRIEKQAELKLQAAIHLEERKAELALEIMKHKMRLKVEFIKLQNKNL